MTESLLPELVRRTNVAVGSAPPVPRARALRTADLPLVAEAGRVALVWFALFVVHGAQEAPSAQALAAITAATAIWLATLRVTALPGFVVFGRPGATALGTALGLAFVALANTSPLGLHTSWPWLAGSALAVFSSVVVWDWFVERALAARRRVLIVGSDELRDVVSDELRRYRHAPFDVVDAPTREGALGVQDLARIVELQRPDFVVLTDEGTYAAALDCLLDARADARVAGFASFFEYAFGRIPVEQITPAWFMSLVHPRQRVYTRLSKRVFDVLVASLGLVLAAPLLAVLALVSKATPGPVLYRQQRVGEGGKAFTIYKFRTMGCDAECDGPRFSDEADGRATRIGAFVRKRHLDELPQLWNVVKGDMSIVGPRPERPEFIAAIEATVPFWNRRLLVKPGITGWAQLRCGYQSNSEGMTQKLSYDLWYLRHRSLFLDLALCLVTLVPFLRSTPRSLDPS